MSGADDDREPQDPPAWQPPPQGPPSPRAPVWQTPPQSVSADGTAQWAPGSHPMMWQPLPPTPGSATAALVFGIASVILCPLVCPAAIVLGRRAMRRIDAADGGLGGRGQAKWGVILGWVGVALTLVMALLVAIYYATE